MAGLAAKTERQGHLADGRWRVDARVPARRFGRRVVSGNCADTHWRRNSYVCQHLSGTEVRTGGEQIVLKGIYCVALRTNAKKENKISSWSGNSFNGASVSWRPA